MVSLDPKSETLVFLPTYNEAGTVQEIHSMIRSELPDADILFIDDASPDGTADILEVLREEDHRLFLIRRKGKLGIGSAHKEAIAWAYALSYRLLITMDSDRAHSPEYLCKFIELSDHFSVVVGSRFHNNKSLDGWNNWRRFLTYTGHFLTRLFLGMEYDATGAYRAYRLDQIPQGLFSLIRKNDYAFFFESLKVLDMNGTPIGEHPIHLPIRTYGNSKMRFRDIISGIQCLIAQALRARFRKDTMILKQ